MIVSVENIFAVLGVAGDVDLRDALGGDVVYVSEGIEAVILRRDVNIIYVEEDAAIGALDYFVQKFPLSHFGDVIFRVAADVFHGDGDFEIVADLADLLRGELGGFKGVGHGEKIVGVAAVNAAPAKMIGEPRGFGALDQFFQAAEMLAIRFFRGAEIHGDAVLDNFILLEDLIENLQGPAAIDHEIFGDDLKPVNDRLAG